MKTVIIEDEQIASQNLIRLLDQVEPDIEIVRVLQSVEESIEFFNSTQDVDLAFMDIHLADGLAFHIFDSATIPCPIIFTTAYDQYALDAFKVNSIDYLLKPINIEDLSRSLQKLKQLGATGFQPSNMEQIATLMKTMQKKKYKSFFLIPMRDQLIPLNVNDIAYIYLDDRLSKVITSDNETHIVDKPLDTIFIQLDPSRFFRANRQYIIAHNAIESISLWPLGKLLVILKLPTPEKIIISRARVAEFKEWYTE